MLSSTCIKFGAGAVLALTLAACGGASGDAHPVTLSADYNLGISGWSGGIADYSAATEPSQVQQVAQALPAPLSGNGYFLAGNNRSDDALIYVKKQFDGLQPATKYQASFTVTFASDAPSGCFGVGGAPGESVYLVAAASTTEPLTVQQADGNYRVNIDRGNQATSGKSGKVLGNIANGAPCSSSTAYLSKTLRSASTEVIEVQADAAGKIWLMLGIDSGFEASGHLYLQNMTANLDPA